MVRDGDSYRVFESAVRKLRSAGTGALRFYFFLKQEKPSYQPKKKTVTSFLCVFSSVVVGDDVIIK